MILKYYKFERVLIKKQSINTFGVVMRYFLDIYGHFKNRTLLFHHFLYDRISSINSNVGKIHVFEFCQNT